MLKNCEKYTGIIADVEDRKLLLLKIEGKLVKVNSDQILKILTYGGHFNPFSKIDLRGNNKKYAKVFKLFDNTEIIGIPFKFVEDMVFILSTEGKVLVFSAKEFNVISNNTVDIHQIFSNPKITFAINDYISTCTYSEPHESKSIRPVQIISDKIKIEEFLQNLINGHQDLKDYQERMMFYPRPFLFPRRNRLGFTVSKNPQEETLPFPLYFQWTSGKKYHYQSVSLFGGHTSPYRPSFETNFIGSTEFKSHILNGYFEGNILSMAAGNNPFSKIEDCLETTKMQVINNFNHMLLMGIDYRHFTLSVGVLHSSLGLSVGDGTGRAISAKKSTPIIRLQYTTNNSRIKIIAGKTKHAGGSDYAIVNMAYWGEQVTRYDINYYYLRSGIEYNFSDAMQVTLEGIYESGKYKETYDSNNNSFSFSIYRIAAAISRELGHYVNIKVNVVENFLDYKSNVTNNSYSRRQNELSWGGSIEFLF